MIKLIKKKDEDTFINNYYLSRVSNNNNQFSVSKNIDIIDHYIWWFKNKRDFNFYKLNNNKFAYFWSEKNNFKNKKFWTCGFHLDNKANIFEVINAYKNFIIKLKKKTKIPILGVTEKKNKFLIKLNDDIGFKRITDKKSTEYRYLKKKYNLKKEKKFIFYKMNTI